MPSSVFLRATARSVAIVVGAWLLSVATALAQASPPPSTLGSRVDDFIPKVRQLNPELAAARLDAAAAAARIDAAGRLPDPTFRTEFEDIGRRRNSAVPGRVGMITYTFLQEFPLWGKRDLQRAVARGEADSAEARSKLTELELVARVKVAFAAYYAAHEATRLTREIAGTVRRIGELANQRYAQGSGDIQESIRAATELVMLEEELARLEAEKQKAAAQLRLLSGGGVNVALGDPRSLRRLPAEAAVSLSSLVERARAANPAIAAEAGMVRAAEASRRLVDKSWYPDVTVGVSGVDSNRRFAGYEAMIEFKIPLQGGLRDAQARETAARLGAARARQEAATLRLEAGLAEQVAAYKAGSRVAALLHGTHLPQARLAFETALRTYEAGRGPLAPAFDAERRYRLARIEHLRALVQQHASLAEIERIVGSDL
jgi:outer membrane protein TolC